MYYLILKYILSLTLYLYCIATKICTILSFS
nr:MAG TPA: hypothetical protein [Caudoviricetes sp.]